MVDIILKNVHIFIILIFFLDIFTELFSNKTIIECD